MGLSIFEDTFAGRRVTRSKANTGDASREYLAEVTSAVQSVVDTFRDPNTGDRYIVSLSNRVEAFTRQGERKIVVSHQPLFDKGIRVSTACTVMTGLVLHEVGHTLYTFPDMPRLKAAFGTHTGQTYGLKPFDALAYTIINIGDDARLEARMAGDLPVARDIFPTTLHWVAMRSGMVGQKRRWLGSKMPMADRVNFAGTAMRYPWTQRWSNDAVTREERLWWQAWRDAYVALTDKDVSGRIALVKDALARLRNAPDIDPTTPPIIDEPEPDEPTPADDFDKDEDDDEAEDDEQDEDEDGDEDGDESGDEGEDDESDPEDEDTGDHHTPSVEDEDGEDGEGASEEDEDGDDEAEDDESDGDDGDGSPTDIPDDLTDEGDSDDGESGDDGDEADSDDGDMKPGDEDEEVVRDHPQDFDAHDLDGNIDALNHSNDGNWDATRQAELLQKLLNEERSLDRVKSGEWGSAKVEMADPMALINLRINRYR